MRNYNTLLNAGTTAQLEKLKENEHKRGFENIDLKYAWDRLDEERGELAVEMAMSAKNYADIRAEAADVANFAHMIILACDAEMS